MVVIDIKVDGEEKTLYMDGKLNRSIETKIKPKIHKKDFDWVWIVDGPEGCQPIGSKVLMADGTFKNIEEIKIGDSILSPQKDKSYLFSKVLRTTKWFSNENYDVIELNRGKKKLYTCSYNHLIPINYRFKPRTNGKRLIENQYWFIKHYSAKNYSKLSRKSSKKNTTTLSSFPIDKFLNRKNCDIEPYTLGVYLGDGSFCGTRLNITSNDIEIIDEVNKHYPIMSSSNKQNTTAKGYNFSKIGLLGNQLIRYGLYEKRSGDKFIPREALLSDIEYRKKLLSGLIDTDGYFKDYSYSITTKSKQLSEDILFLVYTLSGRGNIKKIRKGIKKLNFMGEYYRVSFYLGNINLYLKTKRKIRDNKFFYLSANRKSIDCIKSEPSMVYGFTLDSPSGWYITDNFVITHNSGKSVFSFQLAKVLDPSFNLSRVCMTPNEFTKAILKAKKGQCVIFDEAFTGFSSRASLTEINRLLVSLMMEMRSKNLAVIIVMPTIFLLDRYVALFRAKGLFHVYMKDGRRGRWCYFNNKKKKLLYLKGKKLFSYKEPRSKFRGRFYDTYTVNEEQYREKKSEALMKKSRSTKAETYKFHRDILFWILHKVLKHSYTKIAKMCKENGYKVDRTTIYDSVMVKERELLEEEAIKEEKEAEKREKALLDDEKIVEIES